MKTRLFRVGDRRVLVSQPNVRQYGHLGLEILLSLVDARSNDAAVYFLTPRRVVADGLLSVESPQVPVLRPSALLRAWLGTRWRVAEALDICRQWPYAVRRELAGELEGYIASGHVPKDARGVLKRVREDFLVRNQRRDEEVRLARPTYYRRRSIAQAVAITMRRDVADRMAPLGEELGIAWNRPIVTLHVREAGFKFGREMQDRKLNARDDSTRNARIETYFDAIDELVARGFTVVRIGDPTMTPVRREGVVDLATSPRRIQALEVYCLLKSRFLITGEAGPAGVSYLTNTPSLTVNATDPISSYPIRSDSMYLLKTVVERADNRRLTLQDLLEDGCLTHLRNSTRFRYIDNSSSDIAAAVVEMIDGLDRGFVDSALQSEFRRAVAGAADRLAVRSAYVRKWGTDAGFLGDGRIGRSFVEVNW